VVKNSNLSIDNLFSKLHNMMRDLVRDIDSVIQDNREIGMGDIRELRDHINHRLSKKEEIEDNQKILKLLNLFSEDKAVIEIIREDAEEWVQLLESIEENMKLSGNLTPKEKEEVKEIKRLTTEIKAMIRKSE